jgi:hypothetical protein
MRKPFLLVLCGVGNAVGIRFTTPMAPVEFPRLASTSILSHLPISFVSFFCFIPSKELSAHAISSRLCLLSASSLLPVTGYRSLHFLSRGVLDISHRTDCCRAVSAGKESNVICLDNKYYSFLFSSVIQDRRYPSH